MTEKDLKTTLAWVLESGIAKAPKDPIKSKILPRFVADCPECNKPVKAYLDFSVDDKWIYLPVSFCPRCGTPIDWTEVISKEELAEL